MPAHTAVRAEHNAVPPMVRMMPPRRPMRSTSGPTTNAIIAPPTATQVAISACSASLQVKCPPMTGNKVPNKMKS
ncbi:hypothetical protein D3C76_1551640 [compost metagenome]